MTGEGNVATAAPAATPKIAHPGAGRAGKVGRNPKAEDNTKAGQKPQSAHTNKTATDAVPVLSREHVNQLPLRRPWGARGLSETVALPRALTPGRGAVLLQVKHTALNFAQFNARPGIVPGTQIVGKLVSPAHQEELLQRKAGGEKPRRSRGPKYYVFPHSACWVQRASPCANCRVVARLDRANYEVHKKWPCLAHWVYGETIDGGLQHYVTVTSPEHILVAVPPAVSLHDVCFLGQIAVPFYAYCVDVLEAAVRAWPAARILILLNDAEREANDCLLVRHHLGLENVHMTFTDMARLEATPTLVESYAGRFDHVLVFASGERAAQVAVDLGIAGGDCRARTLAFFSRAVPAHLGALSDRTVYEVRPSYKDKFLLEQLLATLATFNDNRGRKSPSEASVDSKTSTGSKNSARTKNSIGSNSIGSKDSVASHQSIESRHSVASKNTINSNHSMESTTSVGSQNHTKTGRAGISGLAPEIVRPPRKGHVSWLYCDQDFHLCNDDSCNHGPQCQLTMSINRMLHSGCELRRVFFTNRLACSAKINALVL